MKRAIAVSLLASCLALAADAPGMEEMLAKIAAYKQGQDRAALGEFETFLQDAKPEQRPAIEARLLKFIQSDATADGKEFALRELSLIAGRASIPVLSGMLLTGDNPEMARYVLHRMPGPEALAALRAVLPKTSGSVKIGIINSLGMRRDPQAVPAFVKLASDPDPAIATAAISALGQSGDPRALKALSGVAAKTSGAVHTRVSEARLRCADRMAATGAKQAALAVYRELNKAGETPAVRVGALGGIASTAGAAAPRMLAAEVPSGDRAVQTAAIRILGRIPGTPVTSLLMDAYPKSDAKGQVLLLYALAVRGDPAAKPLFAQGLKNDALAVRIAALSALGDMGDAGTVPLLAEIAATREGAEQTAARENLNRLRGADVDRAIIDGISKSETEIRLELIRAAGERNIVSAAGVLLQAAAGPDAEIRRASFRALRETTRAQHVPALLEIIRKTSDANDRTAAAQALAGALRKSDGAAFAGVLSAYQAGGSEDVRAALVDVMGQVADETALPVLRAGLQDASPAVGRAAILALSGWPSPAPMADLLEIARNDSNPARQVLALRGYIRLAGQPSGRTRPETAALLAQAMAIARQAEEKRAVLALVQRFPCQESRAIAQAALNDPEVAREAQAALDRLNRR